MSEKPKKMSQERKMFVRANRILRWGGYISFFLVGLVGGVCFFLVVGLF